MARGRGLFSAFSELCALALHKQAEALSDRGDDDGALKLYLKALKLDPGNAAILYNVGLIHKYRRAWSESVEFNRRALQIQPNDEATRWNLAIAATALGDWATARQVWTACGYKLDDGDGPIESDFGATPVRLNPDGEAEVVWSRRLDPVRARIGNIPLAPSGFFFGDVVLHDGAAQGYRLLDGEERPVFNVFERLERSPYGTTWGFITAASQMDFGALDDACEAAGIHCEDWTSNTQFLCRQCSEGTPHEHHDKDLPESVWSPRREFAFASRDAAALEQVLDDWSKGAGRAVGPLETAR